MKEGQTEEITLKPTEAYGDNNPKLVKKLPRNHLPTDPEPKVGMMLAIRLPNGVQIPARIAAVSKEEITLDLNHPLVGKTLHFKIKLLEISSSQNPRVTPP